MTPELKNRLAKKNQIVSFWQEGKLSDEEFAKEMKKITDIEKELHNADLMQDEMEEVDLKEVMEAEAFAKKAEEEQRRQYEDSVL
jgi:hypothetical protein